ncbi:MAG: 16S rRNA (guanine(527)-N(7))-methyltransferase RsmG [Chloroflexota bacterium]|nr:16S rRNA (guanine(527)-N(7))-methyltransferase RsmG [Chloroflexota bacterium]MDE2958815.1 16S rRNA (guanine(527)-N(7))-methyltransferase RsmG [Chloroflexota bacterium]
MTTASGLGMAILSEQAPRLALDLSHEQLAQFAEYQRLLSEGNRRANLTAITEPEAVQVRHFFDSLTAVLAVNEWRDGLRVIDLGTGAGFPGAPLKIVFPGIHLTLVESTAKKTAFLDTLVASLGLDNVDVVTARVEELARTEGYRGQFDVALARGVAPMSVLVEYALPLCKGHGTLVAWKGKDGPAETQAANNALSELGGRVVGALSMNELSPPLPPNRWLITVEKVRRTPGKYPRRVGVPAKQPL